MFADRTGWNLKPNAITQALQGLREKGLKFIDLTESNPTRCGFRYSPELLAAFSDRSLLTYEPDPKGLLPARQAVSDLYRAKGVAVSPERIVLTASTSEAYSYLFRLLLNPGDQILVPRPGYPLFEHLAGLNDVKTQAYPLRYNGRWKIDLDAVSRLCTEKTRALVAVHPNHPTGACVTQGEFAELASFLRRNRLNLISDEVFAEYLEESDSHILLTLSGDPSVLSFALGGISKFLGLPQMKLSWMAVTGPADLVLEALSRLELVADTYLSVNTPVQQAFPRWIRWAKEIQGQIRQRILFNRRFLRRRTLGTPCRLLSSDGGWTAVLNVPSVREEESWVLDLLEVDRVLVNPGYFFDFEEPGYLVVSLLPPEELFREGIQRLLRRLG